MVGQRAQGAERGGGSLTIGAEALSSTLEGGGSRSQSEDMAIVHGSCGADHVDVRSRCGADALQWGIGRGRE